MAREVETDLLYGERDGNRPAVELEEWELTCCIATGWELT
jgi:hypothetical protein